jgi:serine/threonine protein kinase
LAKVLLQNGEIFAGRYEVVGCIQAGGMGAIYEVIHRQTKRRRALKIMLPEMVENEDLRRRFTLEATVCADIDSEHIVETFDAGIDDRSGAPFLVMELLKGVDLQSHVKKHGALTPQETVYVLAQVAMGLEKTHAGNIVHRDLKPENLFLTKRDDGSVRVKILDFGIAKVVAHATQASKTKVMGTPLYMPPEQINGDARVGRTADLYALTHMAFTLLTGKAYWSEDAKEVQGIFGLLLRLMEGIKEPATVRAKRYGIELPPAFDAWFEKGVSPEPAGRFHEAHEQITQLAVALNCDRPIAGHSGEIPGLLTLSFEEPPTSQLGQDISEVQSSEPTQLEAAFDTGAGETERHPVATVNQGRWGIAIGAVVVGLVALAGVTIAVTGGESAPSQGATEETEAVPAASATAEPEPAQPEPAPSAPVPSAQVTEPSASVTAAPPPPPRVVPGPLPTVVKPPPPPPPPPEPAVDPLRTR